jgi:hypothetical protein
MILSNIVKDLSHMNEQTWLQIGIIDNQSPLQYDPLDSKQARYPLNLIEINEFDNN